jgi:hypothetical protein
MWNVSPVIIFIFLTIVLPILLLLVMPFGVFSILRSWRLTLKWEAGLLLTSSVALLGYDWIQDILGPPLPIPVYVLWALKILAILSPTCIAVAWLRWNGVKWWLCLLLFPFVPLGMVQINFIITFPLG